MKSIVCSKKLHADFKLSVSRNFIKSPNSNYGSKLYFDKIKLVGPNGNEEIELKIDNFRDISEAIKNGIKEGIKFNVVAILSEVMKLTTVSDGIGFLLYPILKGLESGLNTYSKVEKACEKLGINGKQKKLALLKSVFFVGIKSSISAFIDSIIFNVIFLFLAVNTIGLGFVFDPNIWIKFVVPIIGIPISAALYKIIKFSISKFINKLSGLFKD